LGEGKNLKKTPRRETTQANETSLKKAEAQKPRSGNAKPLKGDIYDEKGKDK